MGKPEVRERIWELLEAEGAWRFPGARGRIPNFLGAERAARVLKANPDAPQRPLRALALAQGKRVYMAVPRLREKRPFWLLDPRRLGRAASGAASIAGAARFGRPVALADVEPIDLVVCGSVAVTREGARVGKGGGIVAGGIPMLAHDIPVDVIGTPQETIQVRRRFPRPEGVGWTLLPPDTIEAIPVLRALREARGASER